MTQHAEHAPDTAAPASTGSLHSAAARQRAALADLFELTAWRAAEHESIESDHAGAVAAATEARDAALAAARSTRETASAELERTSKVARDKLGKKHADERLAADKRTKHEHAAAMADLDAQEGRAREGIKETEWVSGAVQESGTQQPRQELEEIRRLIKAELATLDAVEAEARRLAGPRVTVPETRPASDGSPPDAPAAEREPGGPFPDPGGAMRAVGDARESAERRLRGLSGPTLHFVVRHGLLVFLIFLATVGAAFAGLAYGDFARADLAALFAGAGLVGSGLLALPFRWLALRGTRRRLAPLAADLLAARQSAVEANAIATERCRLIEAEIAERRRAELAESRRKFEAKLTAVRKQRDVVSERLAKNAELRRGELDARQRQETDTLEREIAERGERIESEATEAERAARQAFESATAEADERRDDRTDRLRARWRTEIAAIGETLERARRAGLARCAPWGELSPRSWSPSPDLPPAVRVGEFDVRTADLPGGAPPDEGPSAGLAETTPALFPGPALLDVPGNASLLLDAPPEHRLRSVRVLNNAVLRLLTALPPAKVRLTMIDPVGLGQSFAGFMRLADHDEKLVGARIWTEVRHIEARLTDLTEHMENVIQKYLRNEYPSIEAYNADAGEIAEPYRFLVIADFPSGFTEEAARRLASIIESGPRCGVYTLIAADPAAKLPETITREPLEASGAWLTLDPETGRFTWQADPLRHLPLTVEDPPDERTTAALLDAAGRAAIDAGRVEVPFPMLAPREPGEIWSGDASEEIRVPLGRAGATRFQNLALGRGTSQHALIAGKTGSGKSTLLHVLVTNAALWYSPAEVEFYLIDFKKGVEFKAYTQGRLPHARAIAIESDREFGLSVLRRLDDELRERGELFRDLGAQDLAAARRAMGAERLRERPLPRVLLVIDEFQEFFTEDDKIAQDVALLLDRLVRQGRAFGMHVLLGSQTLSGAYSLGRSTMGQMAVRIALQCSETDSYLILSEDNAAARLLTRPGEAIYNDANGMMEGNSPFQVAWLPDATRDQQLARAREGLARDGLPRFPETIVFEGNIPADLEGNDELAAILRGDAGAADYPVPRAWLGEPVAITAPTAAVLRPQNGANLLIVGQQDEAARAMLASAAIALASQRAGDGRARVSILDGTPPDQPGARSEERV